MFLLNPGRYVVADPEVILKENTLKKLLGSCSHLDSYSLKTPAGIMVAIQVGRCGKFITDTGREIFTKSAHIAFIPYKAAEKLLPFEVIRLTLSNPTLLFLDDNNNIVLGDNLTIFC